MPKQQVSNEALVRVTVRVPDSLWRKVKVDAAKQRTTAQAICIVALRRYFKHPEAE